MSSDGLTRYPLCCTFSIPARRAAGPSPRSSSASMKDNASYPWYYPVPGADTTLHTPVSNGRPVDYTIGHIKYGDKLMVGYRYWTTTGKRPLFPFGFGLSYTTFQFSKLDVPASVASGSTVAVSFDVTNTGSVAGAERELKGFEKVRLAPGETKHVTLSLDARAFSYWDESAHKWTIDPGKFVIRVGGSSDNTPLHADMELQ